MTVSSKGKVLQSSKRSRQAIDGWVGFLKSPTKGSESAVFKIIKRRYAASGKSINETVKHPDLDTINVSYKKGILQYGQAKTHAQELLNRLFPKFPVNYVSENFGIYEQYWESVKNRPRRDERTAKNRLIRAVNALGTTSLWASESELQTALTRAVTPTQLRVIIQTVNQLLKFIGSKVKLYAPKPLPPKVSFISEEELKRILAGMEEKNMRLLHQVAFATGARLGEIFALTPESVFEEHVYIATQILYNGTEAATKNSKSRTAPILHGYEDVVKEWAAIPISERLKFRKRSVSKLTRQLSKKLLGRPIKFHSLRSSYVVFILKVWKVGLKEVSSYIGDTMQVTERYYGSFVTTQTEIRALRQHVATLRDKV